MFILVACSDNNDNNATNGEKIEAVNEELQHTLNSIQTDFNYKKEEAAYYKQVIDDLIKDYSDTELKELAIKLWDYELEVNGVSVPVNGIVETQENTIEISLIERQPNYPILPNEIFMQGQISGNYIDHLKMTSNPTETYVTDGTVVTAIHHKFVDVEKGSTISFTVSEELKKRIGLETTQITINKK